MEKQSNDAKKSKRRHSAPARNWVGDNGKIIEPLFADYFLSLHPMRCFQGRLFTVDGMIEEMPQTGEDELQAQIQKTGSAFAVDMLLLKFVQGFPLVGILGGAANPVYYNKVMRYVQLKYQKRYLLAVAQRNGYSLRFL